MSDCVYVEYNQYAPTLKVFINNRDVSLYSGLWALRDLSFAQWSKKLFDELDREINGEYTVDFCSDDSSAEIIEVISKKYKNCLSVKRGTYKINTSLEKRIDILAMLGADTEKKVNVYLLGDEEVRSAALEIISESGMYELSDDEIVYSALPCFEIAIKEKDMPDNRLASASSIFVYISVCDELEDIYRKTRGYNGDMFVLRVGNHTSFSHAENNLIVYDVNADDISDLILQLAADLPLSLLIGAEQKRLINEYSLGELLLTDAEKEMLFTVGNIRPYCTVDLLDVTYLGRSYTLEAHEIPEGSFDEYSLVSSNPDVIKTDGMKITALSQGTSKLKLVKNGDPCDLWEKRITVKKEVIINALAIFPEVKRMTLGSEETIELKYYPEDAVNSFEIKWRTDDESVAAVDQSGRLMAIGPGSTVLHVYTPDAHDRMFIKVDI